MKQQHGILEVFPFSISRQPSSDICENFPEQGKTSTILLHTPFTA
jgi:hypothetical protein